MEDQPHADLTDLEPRFAEEAKKRQLATLKQGENVPVKETIPERDKGQARDQVAAVMQQIPERKEVDDRRVKGGVLV